MRHLIGKAWIETCELDYRKLRGVVLNSESGYRRELILDTYGLKAVDLYASYPPDLLARRCRKELDMIEEVLLNIGYV